MRDAAQEFIAFNRVLAQRNHELMRIKLARMAESPFTFFRGSFHLFARDFFHQDVVPPIVPTDVGPEIELVGDIHSENFGTYKAEDGRIHYDINDFDETMSGRFEFDICRFAVNILLAAQERKDTLENQTAAVLACLASYLQTLQGSFKKSKFLDLDVSEDNPGDAALIVELVRQKAAVKRPNFIAGLTEDKNGKRQIKRSLAKYFNLSDVEKSQAERLVQDFRARWQSPLNKKGFFDIYDICGRISGIGSMGRLRYVVLVAGKGHDDRRNVLLEFKEARPSPYDTYRGRETTHQAFRDRAEKVIACMRAAQPACSPFLGHALDGETSFQVREISPHGDRADLQGKAVGPFVDVLKVQAVILARVHARALTRVQGPTNPLHELADVDRFRQSVLAFALAYADVVRRDWSRFVAARTDLENVAQWAS